MKESAVDGRHLHAFLAVAGAATFAEAAAALGVTQPAVSYRMAQLERQIGVALFERAGRHRVLTPAGRELRAFCARYASDLERLAARLGARPVAESEPVRIAAVSGFGRYVVFPVLCSRPFRDLPLELRYVTADEVFGQVERGDADLGMVYRPKLSSYLDVRELCREELVLIAPPSRSSLVTPNSIDDLAPVSFVTYVESSYVFGAWFEHHFGRQPTRVRAVRRFEELEEVVATVALGSGVSIVPLDSAGEALDAGRIRIVRPRGRPCLNPVHAVTRSGGFRRDDAEAIVEAVRRRGARRTG